MILVVSAIIFIALILAALKLGDYTVSGLVTGMLAAVLGTLLTIALLFAIFNHLATCSTLAKLAAERESLVYQAQMGLYENDNDLGKKTMVDQITEWNANLASNKNLQRDFWVGVFVPNIYDQFEPIPLDIIGG